MSAMLSHVLNIANYEINLLFIQNGFVSTILLAIGVMTSIREWKSRVGKAYALFSFNLFLLIFLMAWMRAASNVDVVMFWDIATNAIFCFIPVTTLWFASEAVNDFHRLKKVIVLCWFASSIFALNTLFTDNMLDGLTRMSWGYESNYGPLAGFFFGYLAVAITLTLHLYTKAYRSYSSGNRLHHRAKWMLIAHLIGAFSLIDLLPSFGIYIYPIGFLFIIVMYAVFSYVVYKFSFQDINARFAAENVVDTMGDCLLVFDGDLNLKFENVAAINLNSKLSKIHLIALVKKQLEQLVPENISGSTKSELNLVKADGTPGTYNLTMSTISQFGATIDAYVCLLHDISERKLLENELKITNSRLEERVSERTRQLSVKIQELENTKKALVASSDMAVKANQLKTDFIANISHEFRTPMHAIINFTDLGMRKCAQNDFTKIPKYLDSIKNASKRLMELINDLLNLSIYGSGDHALTFQSANISNVVEDAIAELDHMHEAKNIDIHIEKSSPEDLLKAVCNAEAIQYVVLSLLKNAIQYSEANSKITISIAQIAVSQQSNFNQNILQIVVTDQGKGIPDNELELIFEKFLQSSATRNGAGGKGLGLSICREIIKIHGGKIWAENNPDGGARISFYIPVNNISQYVA